ncbi:MAG: TauD/TfdA family dioxygenase [Alphaproteobacteria bacterium]|nr:TauD/TfdA family dioxygenase [Alphaproteobacteria bacterium]
MAFGIKKLTPHFVGEMTGVDMRKLDDATFAAVKRAWRENQILVFRGQHLEEEALVEFSQRFGALETHVRTEYLSTEHSEILYVSNIKKGGRAIGILSDHEVGWHYDQIYLTQPAVGSCLYAVKLPSAGGSTYFADMSRAYETLPAQMKNKIDGRKAVQSYDYFNQYNSVATSSEQKKKTPDVEHPIVRTHPMTGRKALYICPGMTTRIVGLSEDESRTILKTLFDWCVQPEFVYRHDWQYGDAVMWDNACTMHRRDPFDEKSERLMKRTTILPPAELSVPF